MARTVAWSDGSKWLADEPTFRKTTEQLGAARESIMGLEPLYARWNELAAAGDTLEVDAFAPTEADRAIFTAALSRALDDARAAGAEPLGFDDAMAFNAFIARLAALHELFMTDVTYDHRGGSTRRRS